jgi:class 3 adenylate cyclase
MNIRLRLIVTQPTPMGKAGESEQRNSPVGAGRIVRGLSQVIELEMEAPELERRLVAIMAADVEGYSRLMHADEDATMSTLSARRLLIDNLINAHRGRIANAAGDSVLAEFVTVLDAVFVCRRDPEVHGRGE